MNICILSGRLKGHAESKTSKDKKTNVLAFVVETVNQYNGGEKKDLVSCVIFNADEALENRLTQEGDGLWIEAQGRVSSNSQKTNGEKRYNSDVIIRHWTFAIVQGEP